MSCTESIETKRDHHQRRHDQRAEPSSTKRQRMRGSGVTAIRSATADAAETTKCIQAPREKLKKQAAQQRRHDHEVDEPDAARHEADDEHQQRKDQERPVDVRILECGADAVVVEKDVVLRHQMEKSDIAGSGRDQRGEDVGAAQDESAASCRRR